MANKMNEKEMILLFVNKNLALSDLDKFIDNNGIDALDRDGRSILFTAIVEKQIHVVAHLIQKGCSVNLQDKNGFSPLHFAVIHDSPEIVELLIKNGASLEVQDRWGNSPLKRAQMTNLRHQEEIVGLLDGEI